MYCFSVTEWLWLVLKAVLLKQSDRDSGQLRLGVSLGEHAEHNL